MTTIVKNRFIKIKLILSFVFLFLFFVPNILLAAATSTAEKPSIQAPDEAISQRYLSEFQRDMFDRVAGWNLIYLGLILGISWLFSSKPFKDDLNRLKGEVKTGLDSLLEKQEKIREKNDEAVISLDKKFNDLSGLVKNEVEAAKKIIDALESEAYAKQKELEKRFETLDLESTWNQFEVSCLNKQNLISILDLVSYLQKSVNYKSKYLLSIGVDYLEFTLDKLDQDEKDSFNKNNYKNSIANVLLSIEKNEDLKNGVKNFEVIKARIIEKTRKISEKVMATIKN